MAAAGNLTLEIRAETTIFLIQVSCMRRALEAEKRWQFELELAAIKAISAITGMVNAARLELGLEIPARVDVGMRVYPVRGAHDAGT
jgi:hypothetical protein